MLRGKCTLVFKEDDERPTLAVADVEMRQTDREMRVGGRLVERVWADGLPWATANGTDGPPYTYGDHLTLVRW